MTKSKQTIKSQRSKIKTIFVLLLICCFPHIQAQQVTISGNAPDYAGMTLTFHTLDNYISDTETEVATCTVAPDGDFRVQFTRGETLLLHVRLGVFKVRFFAEPGFSYEVKLPPRKDKTVEEAASPFFEAMTIYMSLLSVKDNKGKDVSPDDELNMRIIRFDETYNPLYDQLAIDALKRKLTKADSTINAFKEKNPHTDNTFFNDYVTYRTGLLYYAALQSGVKHISEKYFAHQPVRYANEAYMELFNTTYTKYFMYFGRTNEGKAIYDVINTQESFSELKHLLGQDGVLPGDSLRELVILKNIYDEFYADRFSRNALLRLLDSVVLQTGIERHKEIAGQIRSKITKLLRGYEPPAFTLYNQDSVLVSLESYKGKYVYLMFCTTQNYVCLSQYKLLKELHQTHGKWLQIVIVSVDDHDASMRDFRKKNGYQWDFLHYANTPDILEKYDIRIFPACFLINPEGKLVLSPAPAANDNIEQTLYLELRNNGLLDAYIRKGWIKDKKRTNKRFDLDLGIPE